MAERTMLLDSASLYFRAYYGLPRSLRAPDGTPINAVRGFLDFIATLLQRYQPTHVVACWDDDWRPQWRVDLVPSYKAHRVAADPAGAEEAPDELSAQVPIIEEVLEALGIPRVGVSGYEADDVIATLCRSASGPVDVVTGDRDLFQVVDDVRGIRVIYTAGGMRKLQDVDDEWVRAKYGVGAAQYVDYSTLRGDSSDGLPGVPGIGEKTAAKLLGSFGDLAAIRAAAASAEHPGLSPRQAGGLNEADDYLSRAVQVVRAHTAVPVPVIDSSLLAGRVDRPRTDDLASRYGLGGSMQRAVAAVSGHFGQA